MLYLDLIIAVAFVAVAVAVWRTFKGGSSSAGDNPTPVAGGAKRGVWQASGIFGGAEKSCQAITGPEQADGEIDIREKTRLMSQRLKGFEPQEFMEESGKAFQVIITAVNTRNLSILKAGMSEPVYKATMRQFDELDKAGRRLETDLVRIKRIGMQDAFMEDDMAFVEVYIESEQINLLKNKKGKLLAGNENQMELVVDVWRFAKNMNDKNSLWILWETVENQEKGSCNP